MNEFLFDLFVNFNQESLSKFQQQTIMDLLPIRGTPIPDSGTNMWGFTNDGFWCVNATEARLYQHNGIIHVYSSTKTDQYYQICLDLYRIENNSEDYKFSQPMRFNQQILPVDNHPSGVPKNSPISYMQFQLPNSRYGMSPHLEKLINPKFNPKEIMVNYINYITWLFESVRNRGFKFPKWIMVKDVLYTDKYRFVPVLPEFSYTSQQIFPLYINQVERMLAMSSDRISDPYEIINYARTKWTTALQV